MVLRFWLLIIALTASYFFLLFHLSELQLAHGNYYAAKAGAEYVAANFVSTNRGIIYFSDKGDNLLPAVLNKDFPIVYAVPKVIEDPLETANVLSLLLGRSVVELKTVFTKAGDSYEVLAKKADPELAGKIADLKIKGIYTDNEPARFYPLGSLASQVFGFVGPKSDSAGDVGQYGLEKFYDADLTGQVGAVSGFKVTRPTPGKDLTLTIDPNIQIEAEKILDKLIGDYKATGGSIIVEDPKTGKILTMASIPNFDPNSYSKFPVANFLNPTVQKIYEPGSVFKVITMAAGIDSGKIMPQTTYYDTGSVKLNNRLIQNYDLKKHGPYGLATMTNVLEHSINTGAVFAERQIGRDIFTKYVTNFGFGEKTGIDLPGELKGDLRRLSPKERDIAFATASYGQGVAVTPLGLVNSIATIANGGNLMRPYINSALAPKVIRKVISESTAKQVTGMMISAVDKAEIAKISGFTIAGKTGTAFIPDFKNGGYTDKVIDSYVGFGPTDNPRFIALIKIDGLDSSQLAALSVVPAFRDLAQFILNYYGVAPDRITN